MEHEGPQRKEDGDKENEDETKINDVVYKTKYESAEEFKLDESGGVAGVSCFEDLLEIIGPYGRWNLTTLFVCSMGLIVLPFQAITYQFLGATPDYWCHIEALVDANWTQQQILDVAIPTKKNGTEFEGCKFYDYNYTAAVEFGYAAVVENPELISIGSNNSTPAVATCYTRDFNTSQYASTLVTEWDLVCERRALYSTTQAASQFGILLGALSFGYLADMFGRRPIVLISVFLSLITGLGAAAAPVFSIYVILKTLVSCFNFGYLTGTFVYIMELCSPAQRSSIGSLSGLPWSFGYMIVPGIAYLVRPWRWLQVTYSLPIILLSSYYWLLPESPRWLITKGRFEEALKVLQTAARVNRCSLPPKEALIISMKKMMQPSEQQTEEPLLRRIVMNFKLFFVLIMRSEFRKKILICFVCWFSVSMVYYGISLNSGNLSTDPYLYVFLGGLVEVPSYFIMWPVLAYLGRRLSLMSVFLLCGITIAIVSILLATQDEVSFGALIFLSLTGKIAISSAFHVAYIYTAELFPTRYRSLALGESSMMARVGSISSPYINDIFGDAIKWGPTTLFASVSFVAAGLSLLLPETRDIITEEKPSEEDDDHMEGGAIQMNQSKVNEAFEGN